MEELKLILQTLATMGESAKTGFIWWLVIDRLIPTLTWGGCMAGAIYGSFKYFLGIGAAGVETEKAKAAGNLASAGILQLRRNLGIKAYPSIGMDVTAYGLESNHVSEVIEAVQELKKNGG
jgi:hypothetical protein